MGNSGSLDRMILTSYSDGSFTNSLGTMTVTINPESYSRCYQIEYDDTQAQGSASGSPTYNKTQSDQVSFQLIFDGTGVVPSTVGRSDSNDGIAGQIDQFLQLAFTYDGEIHSPNYLQISWGTLVFGCRLSTLKVSYTLFKPDGTPLRAKADVSLIEYQTQTEISKEENQQSADLSKVITVCGGDTLPLLCYRVYGSSVYYAEVARVNEMSGFRDLIPGEKILFPPLGTQTQ